MTDAQLARFSDLESQGARFAAEMGVPLGAYQKMTAEHLFLVMSSPELGGPFATDPGISDDQGLVAAIVKCSPGQGPYLHAHYNTLENFICLDGRFRITWGDSGEHEAFLDPLDTVSVPRGVVRAFENASDGPAHILAFIRGDKPEDFGDVAMTPAAAEDLDATFGDGTADKIKDIGWRFDAGVDAPTAQVNPDEMGARLARFSETTPEGGGELRRYAIMDDGGNAEISGDPGLRADIFEVAPNADADLAGTPGKRTLMCVGGSLTLSWDGGSAEMTPWDTVALPAGTGCHLANAGSAPARLFAMETGV
ncbi:MAG: cupin domain-containing protein, partial [Alphaproteobacteria bacterium]|nr:cupin domain-containing protein [Alphaproteobacteria bacterium]